ncbi:MAG: ImmA/IrrE family metallo-endopeptidase [Candidatus Saccharibacteria bacterium]
MISTEEMLNFVEMLGINIYPADLHKMDKRTDAFAWPEKQMIVIDQSLLKNHRRFRSILAEEIGHCLHPPRSGHVLYHYRYKELTYAQRSDVEAIVAQDEKNAIAWATRFLMPDAEFRKVMALHKNVDKIAEHFDVEPWFVYARLMTIYNKPKMRKAN